MSSSTAMKSLDELVVLKQKDDLTFVTSSGAVAEENTIVIKVWNGEYSVVIPVTDEAEVDKFCELITMCLNMNDVDFDVFQCSFTSKIKEDFDTLDMELAAEVISIINQIRIENANQQTSDIGLINAPPVNKPVMPDIPEPTMKHTPPEPTTTATPNASLGFASAAMAAKNALLRLGKSVQATV